MDLYPRDLGNKWHISVVRYRAMGTSRIQMQPRRGRLGRLWSRGVRLPEEITTATLPLLADTSIPLVAGLGTGLTLFGIAACTVGHQPVPITLGVTLLGLYGTTILVPQFLFRRLHEKPLRHEEIEALKGSAQKGTVFQKRMEPRYPIMKLFQSIKGTAPRRPGDGLEQSFLILVQEILEAERLSATTETEVRRLVKTLGEAVTALPALESIDSDTVTDALVDADTLAARSRREADGVVAESLRRQADANVARAKVLENGRKLARRTNILREELLTQIETVRSLLPSLISDAAHTATDFNRFATLAASVQSVAAEAVSVADAREELDDFLNPRYEPVENLPRATVVVPQPEPAPIRLQQGRRN